MGTFCAFAAVASLADTSTTSKRVAMYITKNFIFIRIQSVLTTSRELLKWLRIYGKDQDHSFYRNVYLKYSNQFKKLAKEFYTSFGYRMNKSIIRFFLGINHHIKNILIMNFEWIMEEGSEFKLIVTCVENECFSCISVICINVIEVPKHSGRNFHHSFLFNMKLALILTETLLLIVVPAMSFSDWNPAEAYKLQNLLYTLKLMACRKEGDIYFY